MTQKPKAFLSNKAISFCIMYKAIAADVMEMIRNMLFTFGKCRSKIAAGLNYIDLGKPLSTVGSFQSSASIREAYIYKLACLDVHDPIDVFDIDQLKRLRRSVVCTFHVNSFAVSFPFDVVIWLDVFESDVLHDSSFQEMMPLRLASR